ncbi:MAG: type II toxin-antitoxin system RelE/ParE family toxin [Oscillospiraceae bacterium]|nr:type II toxin-antitoxin system RelE/ParE family toxin [Oscillospiraceae bacterium]
MNWTLKYLPDALDDLKKLGGSVCPQVFKGIVKVQQNPLPRARGGYGEPLGNKRGNNLTGLYKIKFRSIGVRAVYALEETNSTMTIIVISLRADNEVYKVAEHRREKHEL